MVIYLKGDELEAEIARSPWAPLSDHSKRIFFMKLSRDEVADLLQLSPSRISQLTTEGVIHKDTNGRFTMWEVIREYFGHLYGECGR
jgi:hypothetical protein